jgi:hypothetical protein
MSADLKGEHDLVSTILKETDRWQHDLHGQQ